MEAPPSLTDRLHTALGAISDIGKPAQVLAPSAAYNVLPPVRATAPVFYNSLAPGAAAASGRALQPDVATMGTGTVYCDAAHNVHRLSSESSVSQQRGGGKPKPSSTGITKTSDKPKKPSLLLIVGIIVALLAVALLIAMFFIKKAAAKKKLKELQEAETLRREIDAAEAEHARAQSQAAQDAARIAAQEHAARAAAQEHAMQAAQAAQAAQARAHAEESKRRIDAQVAASRQRAAAAAAAAALEQQQQHKGPRVEDVTDEITPTSTPASAVAATQPQPPSTAPAASIAPASGAAVATAPLFPYVPGPEPTLSIDAYRLRIGEGVSQMTQGVQQAIMAQRTQGPRETQRDESVLMDRSAALLHAPNASQTPLDSTVLTQPVRRAVLNVPTIGTTGALANLEEEEDSGYLTSQ